MIFVDTSALYAVLDADDTNHAAAARTFRSLVGEEQLLTHNYVVVESAALVHNRLGPAATRGLLTEMLPLMEVVWIDAALHAGATAAFLAAVGRRVSLVDWASFEVMRRHGARRAFVFDRHFSSQGFETVP